MKERMFWKLLNCYAIVQCFITLNEEVFGFISNFMGLILFLYIAYVIYKSNKDIKKISCLFMISMFFLIQFIYVIFQKNINYSFLFQGVKIATIIYMIFYLILIRPSRVKIDNYVTNVNKIIYLSIIICFLITGKFSNKSFYGGNEFYGFIASPHAIGLGLISITVYLIYKIFNNEKSKEIYLYGILNTFLIMAFNVRTYIIAYILGVVTIFICTNKKRISWKVYSISISIISIIIFVMLNNKFNIIEVRDFNIGADGESSLRSITSGRSVFWQQYYNYIMGQDFMVIIFGRGIGGTTNIMRELGYHIGTHNDILQILGEYGIIGIVSLITCIFITIIKSINKKNYELKISLLVVWITAMILNGTIYYTFSMIILLLVFNMESEDTNGFGNNECL